MSQQNSVLPRYKVNILFVGISAVVWAISYYCFSKSSTEDLGFHFAGELLKDIGVVVAGLAIVDWLWAFFSGDPVEKHLDTMEVKVRELLGLLQGAVDGSIQRLESSVDSSVERSINGSTRKLESKIESAIDVVGHARHAGVLRIDSNPRALDAGFPTEAFLRGREYIDLCGMTLHALFANGDFISAIETAVRNGCKIRICVAAPSNSDVVNNCLPSARTAMPGQCQAVIDALKFLKQSLRSSPDLADRISLYVLEQGTMSAFISRIDSRMLVVSYLRSVFTMDSPAMLLEEGGERTIFDSYCKEFEYILAVSSKAA